MSEYAIRLVFDDWRKNGKSIYATEEGINLSLGVFHSGTTFIATINIDSDEAEELLIALKEGYQPIFMVTL